MEKKSKNWSVYLFLSIFAIIMLLPYVWMVLTSLKTNSESIAIPVRIFPKTFNISAYINLFQKFNFALIYKNSIIVTLVITVGQVFISALAAYSFARMNFPFKNVLFLLLLSVLMVPGQVFYLPQYIIIQKLGLMETLTAVFLPNLFSAYGTFLLRQFFISLPIDIEEAAKIDGCSRPQIFFKIALPLAKSGMISFSIFAMLFGWNNLLWPSLVASSPSKLTLPIALSLFQGQYTISYPDMMAGALLSSIPLILIFIIFQKQFVEGIAITGIKG